MSRAGQRILQSAREALAYARGEITEGFAVYVPDGTTKAEPKSPKAARKQIGMTAATRRGTRRQ